MTWAKLDDRFPWHPKVVGLSDRAFRLYVSSLCYSAAHDTNGELPPGALKFLGARAREQDELVEAALWDRDEDDGAVRVHDFLKYHPSRAEVIARRDAVAERVRNHRDRQKCNAVTTALQGGVTASVTHTDVTDPCNNPLLGRALPGSVLSVPPGSGSVPDPDSSGLRSSSEDLSGSARVREKRAKSRRWTRVPEDWEPKPDHKRIALEEGKDFARELGKFRDWEFKTPRSDADAAFRTWLRNDRGGAVNGAQGRLLNRAEQSQANVLAVLRRAEAEERSQ